MGLPRINIPNFSGISTSVPVANEGRQAAADSSSTVSSSEDFAAVGALTETAPATDTASSGLNGRLQRIAQRLTSLITLIPTALGRLAAANSFGVVLSAEDLATLGATNEAAPGTDTAQSGINGRLQRIAQRFTSLIALFPSTLGAKTAATSLSVTLPTDGALVTAVGTPADTSATTDTGTFSLIALFKRALGYLATIATNAASTTASPVIMSLPYQAVAVSQTTKILGVTGAAGDTLQGIIIQPTGTTAGSVIVYDGVTAVYTYPGGTIGADLRPIIVGMGMVCATAWKVTTPSNATVLALGSFT